MSIKCIRDGKETLEGFLTTAGHSWLEFQTIRPAAANAGWPDVLQQRH